MPAAARVGDDADPLSIPRACVLTPSFNDPDFELSFWKSQKNSSFFNFCLAQSPSTIQNFPVQIELFQLDGSVLVTVEEWKGCPSFPGYLISSFGRVKNEKTRKFLQGTIHETGYRNVGFQKDGKMHTKLLHRLVALAFLEPPSPQHVQVNHKNKNRLDCRLENLEWVTPSENMLHALSNRRDTTPFFPVPCQTGELPGFGQGGGSN